MSSVSPENGCALSDDNRTKRSLKSAVIADDDPLKIKLKICKRDIAEVGKNKKDLAPEVKSGKRSVAKSEMKLNGDEKMGEEGFQLDSKGSQGGDPRMKLRSKRETEDESEQKVDENEDGTEEKKKKKELPNDKEGEKTRRRSRTGKSQGEERLEEGPRRKSRRNESETSVSDKSKALEELKEVNKESFCWTCHKDGSVVRCDTCPRVFHLKCVSLTKDPSKDWICPECSLVLHAEKFSTRSEAMKSLSLDQLCTLLNFAIGRMKNVPESEAFWKPVDPKEVPFYDKYITNPMDLNLLERNMKAKMYGSPQAFLADAKWLLHNSIIFNSTQSPLTSTARFLVKICRQEMAEIENCPDCYLNAHTKKEWFIEVCRKPHILIWARLKGFPFWPAKAMTTNLKTQQVDARFFGAHDKAWVPVKECYLYSRNSPQLLSKKRADLDDAFLEAEGYIKKIKEKYGAFCYAPDKTPFMPEMYDKQLQSLIPNYKEEKSQKKKRKSDQVAEECCVADKPCQNGKKASEQGAPHRFKLRRPTLDEGQKTDGDICPVNDYVSEEKVVNDGQISPEDEIARSLEIFASNKKEVETVDDASTDLDEDESIPIPEHGYSRSVSNSEVVQSSSSVNQNEEDTSKLIEESDEIVQGCEPVKKVAENECVAESSERVKPNEGENSEKSLPRGNSDQCEVSSTSVDLKSNENGSQNEVIEEAKTELPLEDSKSKNHPTSSQDSEIVVKDKPAPSENFKKDEEKSQKSFVNLTCDQKQKILTEAKLLANIDEMTALEKQKVLNELGLDASQVDIRQLAQENRQILETLVKKCQNEKKTYEEISIKDEDFEQYLIEENSEVNVFEAESLSVKDREVHSSSKRNSTSPGLVKNCAEPMLKIMDVKSLKQSVKEPKGKRKKSLEDISQLKKLNLDPVIKLRKLDSFDNSVEKLNRKLRLSDEVSLLMVDGEKKVNVDVESVKASEMSKAIKPPRARKSMPNRAKSSFSDSLKNSSKNINVISVDTENSAAQKNLLKSLCLEEKKPEETGRKAFLITTNCKGIKNVDEKSKTVCEPSVKKPMKEATVGDVKDTGRGPEIGKEGNLPGQKNLTVMTNSHLIVTNGGSAIVANQGSQPNLAFTQNNLGQLSLVHLSNLTSGIQTNFINLTNETIGFNNSIGTLYTASGFSADFPASSATGSVILSPSLTSPVQNSARATESPTPKGGKSESESTKLSLRVGSGKPSSGISVKSPASLGLVTSQPSKPPPVMAIPGNGIPLVGEVGPVTAELNKHSIKMAEYMKATIEDLLRELSNQGSLEAKYKLLTIEMEKLQWRHQQEIMELKHHSERSMMELRNSLESEKQKCLGELKAQLESQHQKVISETKRKQWCANCGKEALFYCCWNTSYCDYPCQQQHWPGHMSTCAQLGNNVTIVSSAGSQLQNKTPGMKYQNSNYVPIMSRGSNGGSNGGGGSHSGGAFAASRAIPTTQTLSSQARRSSDPSVPQLPINITIRPQHYFM